MRPFVAAGTVEMKRRMKKPFKCDRSYRDNGMDSLACEWVYSVAQTFLLSTGLLVHGIAITVRVILKLFRLLRHRKSGWKVSK